ncbi:hypothetical protein M8J77_012104 [Diaphorina citri]|nr:hypothetical protein M8J77_012104 [Diaphorina citri]
MRIKFHALAGIEPTPSCLPGERLDHYATEAGGVVVKNCEELTYDIDDKARPGGEFTCRVELPCESYIGRNLTAEISVKGKKKEVVIQCALEACRLLDRYGLLRQANHESKSKRRRKQQEDEDYDSDDDTFFDRTGTVEAKRSKRSGAVQAPAETYTSLLAKHADLVATIGSMEARLADMQARVAHKVMDSEAEDSLDAYMKSGYSEDTTEAKIERRRLKVEIASLKKQEETTRKLVNIAKPTSLPELKPPSFSSSTSSSSSSAPSTTSSSSAPSSSVPTSIKSHPKGRRRNEDKGSSGTTREDKSSNTTCQEKSSTTSDDRMECDKEKEEEEEEEEEGVCKAEDVEIKTTKDSTNKRSSHTGVKSSSSKPPPVSTLDFIQRNSNKQSPNPSTKSKPISEPISSMNDEEFSTTCWQPPKNQTGDGRTALNDKYGY